MTLDDIALRIKIHLQRFEVDTEGVNKVDSHRLRPYYLSGAYRAGAYVSITYVSFQGRHNLRRADAERYLAWLDAGNVGRHWAALYGGKGTS
jgi:hypothetical protein